MIPDPESPEVLLSVPNEIEAAVIVGALAEVGIEARATGGHTSGFRAEAPGDVTVVVKRVDVDRAKSALAAFWKEQHEVDWSHVDVGDPDEPDAEPR